ncbi:MAG: 5-formyltetrahydrofolate cyclo-ligase [Pseudomonadota bacterium]
MSEQTDKSTQRREATERRRSLSAEQRTNASLAIAETVKGLPSFQRARQIALYLPTDCEVNTWPLAHSAWRMRKRIFAPIVRKTGNLRFCELTTKSKLVHNKYGIAEPSAGDSIDPKRLDVVLLPLVAFDSNAYRLGWGGGYFDRTFAFANLRHLYSKPKLIGLGFACQELPTVVRDAWDIPLFQIVTESSVVTRER